MTIIALKVRRSILKSIRTLTGSQCNEHSTGVIGVKVAIPITNIEFKIETQIGTIKNVDWPAVFLWALETTAIEHSFIVEN